MTQKVIFSPSQSSRELRYLILLAGSWYDYMEYEYMGFYGVKMATNYIISILITVIKGVGVSDSSSRQLVCRPTNATTLKTLLTHYSFTIQAYWIHYCSAPVPNYSPNTTLQYKQCEPTTTLQYQQYLPTLHFSIYTLLHYLNYQTSMNIFLNLYSFTFICFPVQCLMIGIFTQLLILNCSKQGGLF